MHKESNIFVAGHKGLVGSSIVRKLKKIGYKNIITRNRNQLDLMDSSQVNNFFKNNSIDYVFDAAARVGGIHANNHYSAEFIYENTLLQMNLMHYSNLYKIKKFIFLGSVCIYPKYAETPVKEDALLKGELEPTNEAYAISKIHGIHMLKAYNKQYGMKGVSLMPSNLYGPNDNYHPDNGHVIPSLIHKLHNQNDKVVCWGDGSPRREFLYVDDLAEACIFAADNYSNAELINVGSGEDISIKELVKLLVEIIEYKGEISWDNTKPNGTPKRPLDYSKIQSLGWQPKYSLREGLKKSYEWYRNNIDLVRTKVAD
jgi:GDP-L-fucose synthase